MVAMGGRAAEDLVFGEFSTGASNDIQQATKLAWSMVTHYGMSAKLGPVHLDGGDEQVFLGRDIGVDRNYGEDTAEIIDDEVQGIIRGHYAKTKRLLTDNLDKLHLLAKRLIETETVEGDDLRRLLAASPA
jgi:cell division protease FtsH